MDENLNELDFTYKAWDTLYDTVDSKRFRNEDAEAIYEVLQHRLRPISFGDYLKRYIYRKAQITEPYEDVNLDTYRLIIKESFADNSTPPSFEPTTAKLSALSKNWLTQSAVKRNVVFLLGFGLSMDVQDVNTFLTKALREQEINAKNPFEVICWYCYKNGYNYLKFRELWNIYLQTEPNTLDMQLLYSNMTIMARSSMHSINSDAALVSYVSKLKAHVDASQFSVTARKYFDALFLKAKELVANLYNEEAREQSSDQLSEYKSQLLNNERLMDSEIQERLDRKRRALEKAYTAADITESDLEHIISSAIPVDRNGNLTPGKASHLNAQFEGKRFNRQHISDILMNKSEVTRFDLITLNFFIFSQSISEYPDPKTRFLAFVDSTNEILASCTLGELYISNPYECFVLMCILSDEPLSTYADVWELSYEGS